MTQPNLLIVTDSSKTISGQSSPFDKFCDKDSFSFLTTGTSTGDLFLGALYPSKFRLMNKHIVKHTGISDAQYRWWWEDVKGRKSIGS
jgi:hypothetical protein